MTLVYTVQKQITNSTGLGNDNVFSGNGAFDPDITAAGQQPANYDDWASLYGRYRIRSSRLIVWPASQGSGSGTGVYRLLIAARHTTTAITSQANFDSAASQPFSEMVTVDASGGNAGLKFSLEPYKAHYSTAQVLGYSERAVVDDDTLQALTSANPTHQWYWHIMMRAADDTSVIVASYYVKIEYDIEFFDRLDTSLDLSEKIHRDLVRLLNRAKREEKTQGTREALAKSKLLSELLFEYTDQILDPYALNGDSPPVLKGQTHLGRTALVTPQLSNDVAEPDVSRSNSLRMPILRRSG